MYVECGIERSGGTTNGLFTWEARRYVSRDDVCSAFICNNTCLIITTLLCQMHYILRITRSTKIRPITQYALSHNTPQPNHTIRLVYNRPTCLPLNLGSLEYTFSSHLTGASRFNFAARLSSSAVLARSKLYASVKWNCLSWTLIWTPKKQKYEIGWRLCLKCDKYCTSSRLKLTLFHCEHCKQTICLTSTTSKYV